MASRVVRMEIDVEVPVVSCLRCKDEQPVETASVRENTYGRGAKYSTASFQPPAGWARFNDGYLCATCGPQVRQALEMVGVRS